jgi:AcrR family transcriptional regulator
MALASTPRSTRRRPSEVRALLVEAAAAEFAARGVHAVTTRDICRRAGVSLSVMYRHFDDKTALFREAMLTPLTGFAEEFTVTWAAQREEPWDAYRLMRSFVASLHGSLVTRRDSLVALMSATHHEEWDVVRELQSSIARMFEDLTIIGNAEAEQRGWFSTERLDLAIRLIVGQILGFIAFESLLLAGSSPDTTTEQMLDEIAALVIWGLRRAPGPPGRSEEPSR